MTNYYDVVIGGGGVIGLSIAFCRALAGAKVLVFDRGTAGQESSWAGAGILPPPARRTTFDPLVRLQQLSYQTHLEWHARLKEFTGIDSELQVCGGLYVAGSRAEFATLQANEQWWSDLGVPFERVARDKLTQIEPHLHADRAVGGSAWVVPSEAQVRNPRHLRALRAACEKLSVEFVEHAELREVDIRSSRIRGVLAGQERIEADAFCFCAGAWSRQIGDLLGVTLEVYPVRGQMVLFHSETRLAHRIINDGNRYIVPRNDGHVLVGSSEEEVGFVKGTTDSVIQSLIQWSREWLPSLGTLSPKQCWSGLRPASIDGLPYIGKVPGLENGYVATGHYRWGLCLSTGTALIMDAMLGGSPSPMDAKPFRLLRGHTSTPSTDADNEREVAP